MRGQPRGGIPEGGGGAGGVGGAMFTLEPQDTALSIEDEGRHVFAIPEEHSSEVVQDHPVRLGI